MQQHWIWNSFITLLWGRLALVAKWWYMYLTMSFLFLKLEALTSKTLSMMQISTTTIIIIFSLWKSIQPLQFSTVQHQVLTVLPRQSWGMKPPVALWLLMSSWNKLILGVRWSSPMQIDVAISKTCDDNIKWHNLGWTVGTHYPYHPEHRSVITSWEKESKQCHRKFWFCDIYN